MCHSYRIVEREPLAETAEEREEERDVSEPEPAAEEPPLPTADD